MNVKKSLKWVFICCGVFVALVVIIGLIILATFGSIVKGVTENVVPQITKTPATLESCSLNVFNGTLSLSGFKLGNPEGFDTEHSVKFAQIMVDLDMNSLSKEVIIIEEVLIDGVDICYEQALTTSNIHCIKNNAESFGQSEDEEDEESEEKTESPKEESVKPSKKVVIKKLTIKNAKVRLALNGAKGTNLPIPLPEIVMENIGSEKEPASISEVISDVLTEISQSVISVVGDVGSVLKNTGSAVLDSASETGNSIIEGAGSVLDSINPFSK